MHFYILNQWFLNFLSFCSMYLLRAPCYMLLLLADGYTWYNLCTFIEVFKILNEGLLLVTEYFYTVVRVLLIK